MRTNSNTPPTAAQGSLAKAERRRRVQLALDHFCAGQASESDLAIFRERHFMNCATAEQACKFIEAAAGRTFPHDVLFIWANVLRYRWLQSLSGRRSGGSMLSQDLVEVPAAMHLAEEDSDDDR